MAGEPELRSDSDHARRNAGVLQDLAELEAKKAAATKRDEIDAKLAKLDEKAEAKGEAPSTVDSFADAMADGLRAFGYQVEREGQDRHRSRPRLVQGDRRRGACRVRSCRPSRALPAAVMLRCPCRSRSLSAPL